MSLATLYRSGLAAPVMSEELEPFRDIRAGVSMFARGLGRGKSALSLYKAGITGEAPVEVSVGAHELFEGGLMKNITGFLVDLAHILLMCGGIYLLLASFGWVR